MTNDTPLPNSDDAIETRSPQNGPADGGPDSAETAAFTPRSDRERAALAAADEPQTRRLDDGPHEAETRLHVDGSSIVEAAAFAPPGYCRLKRIGRGGMGEVFQAEHAVLGRTVAIKVPFGDTAGTEVGARFLREARSAARLRHPHICPIHEIGEAHGRPYLVLAFIAGESLEALLNRQRIEPVHAARLMVDLAGAIQYAHEQGVVHRDLKPGNVMIEAGTGQPHVLDFGLAKELAEENSDLTQTGQIMGTPSYMAPEQARGRVDLVGPKSDVYALGAMLYRMLAGQRPFDGPVGEVLLAVQFDQPRPPRAVDPRVPRDLETICLKAMAKEPDERYATAGALAEDLQRFLAGEPIRARRTPLWIRGLRFIRRNPTAAALAAGLLVAACAIGYFMTALSAAGAGRAAQLAFTASVRSARTTEIRPQVFAEQAKAWLDTAKDEREREEIRRSIIRELSETLHAGLTVRDASAADYDRLEHLARLLATWDETQAEAFETRIRNQRADWQVATELAAPFTGWEDVFSSQTAELRADGIHARSKYGRLSFPAPLDRPLRVTADFSGALSKVSQLGFVISSGPDDERRFLVVREGVRWRLWLGDHRQRVLRSAPLPSDALQSSPLRLSITREGRRIAIELAGRPAVTFNDFLRSYGPETIAIIAPPDVAIARLVVQTKSTKTPAGPFPSADAAVRADNLEAAMPEYAAASNSPDTAVAQEARFKFGYCLFRLRRDDEALLSFPVAERGEEWPHIARAYAAATQMRTGAMQNALRSANSLGLYFDGDAFVELVAESDRQAVLAAGVAQLASYDILSGGDDDSIAQLKIAIACFERLRTPPSLGLRWTDLRAPYVRLAQLLQFRDRTAEALKVVENVDPYNADDLIILREHVQILRRLDRAADAAQMLRKRIASTEGDADFQCAARIHLGVCEARMGHFEEAERQVRDALERLVEGRVDRVQSLLDDQTIGSLLLGFLLERRGDLKGAREAWATGAQLSLDNKERSRRRPVVWRTFALAALAETLDPETLDTLYGYITSSSQAAFIRAADAIYRAEGGPQRFAPTFTRAFHRPAARAFMRDLAFGMHEEAEGLLQGMSILLSEVMREISADARTTSAQDRVLDDAAAVALREYGPLAKPNPVVVMQLAMAGKGVLGSLGWASAAPNMSAAARSHAAYCLAGMRLRAGALQDAKLLYRDCLQHAPADSTLARLAAAHLAALEAGQGLLVIENTTAQPVEISIEIANRDAERALLAAGQILERQLPVGEVRLVLTSSSASIRLVESQLMAGPPAGASAAADSATPATATRDPLGTRVVVGATTPVFVIDGM